MTRALFLGIRLAAVLLLASSAAGCGGPTQYALKVDSPVVPFKPADPEDLVVQEEEPDEDEDEEQATPGEE
jgi:hypothetical protein